MVAELSWFYLKIFINPVHVILVNCFYIIAPSGSDHDNHVVSMPLINSNHSGMCVQSIHRDALSFAHTYFLYQCCLQSVTEHPPFSD